MNRCSRVWLHTIRGAVLLSAALVLAATAGCGQRRPMTAWRETVERYVRNADGDPAALRELREVQSHRAVRPARISVGVLDVPGPVGRVRDVQGVLVGNVEWRGHAWYVFVVGITDRSGDVPRRIADIRVVAFRTEPQGLVWLTGPRDRNALRRYVTWRRDDEHPIAFPGPIDRFILGQRPTLFEVTEQSSGASWILDPAEAREQRTLEEYPDDDVLDDG